MVVAMTWAWASLIDPAASAACTSGWSWSRALASLTRRFASPGARLYFSRSQAPVPVAPWAFAVPRASRSRVTAEHGGLQPGEDLLLTPDQVDLLRVGQGPQRGPEEVVERGVDRRHGPLGRVHLARRVDRHTGDVTTRRRQFR